jgi:hypothetical protein
MRLTYPLSTGGVTPKSTDERLWLSMAAETSAGADGIKWIRYLLQAVPVRAEEVICNAQSKGSKKSSCHDCGR